MQQHELTAERRGKWESEDQPHWHVDDRHQSRLRHHAIGSYWSTSDRSHGCTPPSRKSLRFEIEVATATLTLQDQQRKSGRTGVAMNQRSTRCAPALSIVLVVTAMIPFVVHHDH